MAAQLLAELWVNGYSPAPSGTVSFYQPGTLVSVTVYSNDAANAVVTQPVALDANGRTSVPIYTIAPVRAIISSSTGAQLLDIERINGVRAENSAEANASWTGETTMDGVLTALATSLGGTDGNFKSTGSGAVQRFVKTKLSELPSLKDWNAKGDGVTDDYAAINAATAAVSAAGGGQLLVPAGTYVHSNTLVIPANVCLKGVSNIASVFSNGGSNAGITMTSLSRIVLEDIGVTASVSLAQNGITATSCSYVVLSRVRVTNYQVPVSITDNGSTASQFNKVIHCELISDGSASGKSINLGGSVAATGSYTISGNTLTGTGGTSATLVYVDGTVSSVSVLGNNQPSPNQSIGLRIASTHTGSKIFCFGNDFSATTTGARIDRATGPQLMEFGNAWGGVTDSSDGNLNVIASPFYGAGTAPPRPSGNAYATQTFSGNGTFTPDMRKANFYAVNCSGAGSTVTIASPASGITPFAGELTMILKNTSGGAVTWTFNAVYLTSGAVAPGAGLRIAITFRSDSSVGWYETSRSAAY